MFPPFWPPLASALLEELQGRFDTAFRLLLSGDPFAVAQTPAEVVFSEQRMRLLRYRRSAAPACPTPVLIVPSVLNRYYALDLMPGQSLVEYLVGRGLDVFLLDWGAPTREDRRLSLDFYIEGLLRHAIGQTTALGGAPPLLLGYSLGGTLAAIATALAPRETRALALLAAPIDFHDDGLLSQWTRPERFNVDLVVDTLGSMPIELLQASFRMLQPTAQIAQRVALADRLGDTQSMQDFLAMQAWIDESIPFIGEAYRKLMKECYQQNALAHGRLVIDGRRVDLGQIACPVLAISAAKDCICPPQSAQAIAGLVGGPVQQINLSSGHIGVVAGRLAATELWPQLADWLIAQGAPAPAPAPPPPDPAPPAPRRRAIRKPRS